MLGININNVKCDIEYYPLDRTYRIWLFENTSNCIISYHLENGEVMGTRIPYGTAGSVPFLTLQSELAKLIFNQIGIHLEQSGNKTVNENLIEGKLIATEKHLEDLKTIAFKLLKIQ